VHQPARNCCQPQYANRASISKKNTYPRPMLGEPHQKRKGKKTMKNVCVPRFAVNAKYESRVGVRTFSCTQARYGVSYRINGMSFCRGQYRQEGNRFESMSRTRGGQRKLRRISHGWASWSWTSRIQWFRLFSPASGWSILLLSMMVCYRSRLCRNRIKSIDRQAAACRSVSEVTFYRFRNIRSE